MRKRPLPDRRRSPAYAGVGWATRQPALLLRVPFGKHRGRFWSEIPHDYLDWAARQNRDDRDLAHTIRSARKGRFLPPIKALGLAAAAGADGERQELAPFGGVAQILR